MLFLIVIENSKEVFFLFMLEVAQQKLLYFQKLKHCHYYLFFEDIRSVFLAQKRSVNKLPETP